MIQYKCNYCGSEWTPEKTYFFTDDKDDVCPKCGDTNIRKLKYSDEEKDYFGYNLDFLKTKKKKDE